MTYLCKFDIIVLVWASCLEHKKKRRTDCIVIISVHIDGWYYTSPNGCRHSLANAEEARKALKEGKPVFALSATGTLTPPVEKFLLNGRKFRTLDGTEYRIV